MQQKWLFVITPKTKLIDLNLKEVWQYRDLLMLFVKRDVITLYKQTILGPLWYLIQPLFTSIIFTLIFNNLANISTGTVPPFLFNLAGITIWAIQMIWIPVFAAGVINGIGHSMGYRNFECKDASKNITPWAFFIGGEELHNNHHTYPNSAKLSVKSWEFDIGWMCIQLFSKLGLAKARHIAPTAKKDNAKHELDDDSLMAIIHNRFFILFYHVF